MKKLARLIAFSLMLLSAAHGAAQEAQSSGTVAGLPAIGGYSPVSYFTENAAERGSPEFSVQYDGLIYFLTSQEQVDIFTINPGKYRPLHKMCPYSLSQGKVLPLDPTNFKIVGDSLLLFHLSDEEDGLLDWNNSKLSDAELIRQANANLFLIDY